MDKTIILKIAKLSKLNLSDEDLVKFEAEFIKILDYMKMLEEVNVDGVEPYMTPITGNLREDEIELTHMVDKKDALNLAHDHDDNFYLVPTVSVKK